jgi:hypothetical protein
MPDSLSSLASQIAGRAQDPEAQEIKAKEQELSAKAAALPAVVERQVSKDFPERPPPPKPPQLKQFQPPPQRGALDSFGNFATALGALAGLLTRQPLTASLNAASAAMKALKQNDIAAYEQAWEQYKQQQDYAFKMAAYENERYKTYLEDKNMMTNEILGGLGIESSILRDENMRRATETGDLATAADIVYKKEDLRIRAQEAANRIDPIMGELKREIQLGQITGPDGKPLPPGDPRFGNAVAGRLAELNRMADPTLQETIRRNKAAEGIRQQEVDVKREATQKKAKATQDELKQVSTLVDQATKMVKDHPEVAGTRGMFTGWGETLMGITHLGTPTEDRQKFESQMTQIQMRAQAIVSGSKYLSATRKAQIQAMLPGLGRFESAEDAKAGLGTLKTYLDMAEGEVPGEATSEEGEYIGNKYQQLNTDQLWQNLRDSLNKAAQ